MNTIETEIAIIGGGLTGLCLAHYLQKVGRSFVVLESRSRLGGRILTQYDDKGAPVELGATWLGSQHSALLQLLGELDVGIFEQALGDKAIYEPISTSPYQLVQLPPNSEPSFRIKGGSSQVTNALAKTIDENQVYLDQTVKSIRATSTGVELHTGDRSYKCKYVVSTLPPNLLVNKIQIEPAIESTAMELMRSTHTWMGESIKVALLFDQPFWRVDKWSGTVFSNVGPVSEFYDHSNFEDDRYALMGFLNGAYYTLKKEERRQLLLSQMRKYFGSAIDQFTGYEEYVWIKDANTYEPYEEHVLPHQNNGHAIYQQTFLDGKLFIAGAETATINPGYMNGAIHSAQRVFNQLHPSEPKA